MSVNQAPRPLAGQAALVTGSARNIGREIALALAESGADVLINARADRAAADAVAAEVAARGVRSAVHMADIGIEADAEALVAATKAAFGRLDIVVLNAAVRRRSLGARPRSSLASRGRSTRTRRRRAG